MEIEFLNKLNIWLISPQLQEQLREIKIVFILFGALFLIGIFYFLFKSSFLKTYFWQDWTEFLSYKGYGLGEIDKKWRKIQEKIETDSQADWKMAIIESEDLFNKALERAGFEGKNLEERLKGVEPELIPNTEEVLKNHKIYQDITADSSYHLTIIEAKKFLDTIEKVLKNLGVI